MIIIFHYETDRINSILKRSEPNTTELEYYEKMIDYFIHSPERGEMLTAVDYYDGRHDILKRKRTAIGQNGELEEIDNLPNSQIVDNQYARMVDQKVNYIVGSPITIKTENEKYHNILNNILDEDFMSLLREAAADCVGCGIGYIYVYVDNGIRFSMFRPYEVIPFWSDFRHKKSDAFVRVYDVESYDGDGIKSWQKAEIYDKSGIKIYLMEEGRLVFESQNSYIDGCNWGKIPIIALKSNSKQIPLIRRIKNLQDCLNTARSDFMNNIREDCRNTILVLKNYDGTDLGEFRKNLSLYGAVKVRGDGGIETLKTSVDSQSYVTLCDMLKKSIIENARGFDARDERMSSNPNQMNIRSMYSDIDLDTNMFENELQNFLKQLKYFIDMYLYETGEGDFFNENVEFVFNRSIPVNENEIIENCVASRGIISDDTIMAKHPWVNNIMKEKHFMDNQEKE